MVALGILIGAALFGTGGLLVDDNGYGANVYTSIISTIVTVGFIDRLNRLRDERNATKQLQEQLVRDASSRVNDVANNAVHQLGKRNWLRGDKGLLVRADLVGANLQGADLWGANLQEADLRLARLQMAILRNANLQGANLTRANLQGAILLRANMKNAKFDDKTHFDETTMLPDGKHWTQGTDMAKFTKPAGEERAE